MPHAVLITKSPRLRFAGAFGALAIAGLVAAAPARAQDSGKGFLLATPVGSVSLRGGYDHAMAGSDVFSDAASRYTLSKNDFSGVSVAADIGVRISDRLDFILGSAYSGSSVGSEARGYAETVNGQEVPIEQTTTFRRVPITASMRAYLTPRGRSVGQFAWIPNKLTPYVGGGVGLLWYQFKQDGDFVDFATPGTNKDIFTHTFESQRWTTEAHAFAGVDYSLSPRWALTGEARYTVGRAPLDKDVYTGYNRIDLSGLGVTAGFAVRF
jgi:hypothetical protein